MSYPATIAPVACTQTLGIYKSMNALKFDVGVHPGAEQGNLGGRVTTTGLKETGEKRTRR